jgi:peroxiredoxin
MKRRRTFAFGRAAFGALLACAVATPAFAVPHEGDGAPEFSLPSARGGTVTLAAYKGKPLYLNFFASWCAPCNDEAGDVGLLYAKYHRAGLAVVGVDELEDKVKALGFARRYSWPFAVALDGDGALVRSYGVIGLPVHVFIDRHGKISLFRLGEMQPGEIRDAIEKIVAR